MHLAWEMASLRLSPEGLFEALRLDGHNEFLTTRNEANCYG
jgi:hypothetical protein